MRVCARLEKLPAKIGLLLLGIGICSCNALKRVDEDELLLSDYTILADGEKVTDPDINSLVLQKPNSRVLGVPLQLHLYNLAKKDPDSSFQAWLYRKPERRDRLSALLSEKQTERLGETWLVSGYSNWLKRVGEAPVVIDSARTSKTVQRLSAFYDSRGYFDNTGTFEVDSTGRQRAAVQYSIDLGQPYVIDTLSRQIASPALDSLYLLYKDRSLVRQGDSFDLANFTQERERLTSLFRNSGIWNFQESSITYDILRDTLNRDDPNMEVELNIENLRSRGDTLVSTPEYRVHRMGAVNVYADYDFQYTSDELESVTYGNYRIFYKDRLRYRPKALIDAVFLQKDSVYRDLDRLRTYRQINNLNTFRYPTIELLPNAGNRPDANI